MQTMPIALFPNGALKVEWLPATFQMPHARNMNLKLRKWIFLSN
jgi:hypothetical protein